MIHKKAVRKPISEIKISGVIVNDSAVIAEKFNNFFTNVGPDLAKVIPTCNKKPTEFLKHSSSNSLFFNPTNPVEIFDIISNLKKTDSLGHDSIPLKLIQFCKLEFSKILSNLNNSAMMDGIFPDNLKVAKITPVFKAGDSYSVTTYRPISILTIFSKIFEKVICSRLENYLETNNILHKNQFGFRRKVSTCTALLQLVDKISTSIDKRKTTIGVFIDLAKAFDTVDHQIL